MTCIIRAASAAEKGTARRNQPILRNPTLGVRIRAGGDSQESRRLSQIHFTQQFTEGRFSALVGRCYGSSGAF
jgi:hypothetical protein